MVASVRRIAAAPCCWNSAGNPDAVEVKGRGKGEDSHLLPREAEGQQGRGQLDGQELTAFSVAASEVEGLQGCQPGLCRHEGEGGKGEGG